MFTFEFQGKEYHIDDYLKAYADRKIIPDMKRKDKDAVFLVDGKERIGKSVFSQGFIAYCAYSLGVSIDISHICMTPVELRQKIQTANRNECVIYDEAHRGMASSRSLSEVNNILKDLMMEMGQRNLLVIIVLPSFFLLDKYAAIFRSIGLFHIYENKGKRGYWCYFNEKNKLKLYLKGKKEFNYHAAGKWPRSRGRFYNEYVVDEASYRDKKAQSFKNVARLTKQEAFMAQRNACMYAIHNEFDLDLAKLARMMKKYRLGMARTSISDAIASARLELGEVIPGIPDENDDDEQ